MVTARCLALPIGQIKQISVTHRLETLSQLAIHMVKNILGTSHHVIHFSEGFQRRATQWIHTNIPGSQRVELHFLAAFSQQLVVHWHHNLLHRLVKFKAIVRLIIKTAFRDVLEFTIIFESRIGRNGLAQGHELLELIIALVGHLKAFVGHQLPRLLPQRAIILLQIYPHLHQCFFLPLKLHRQRPHHLLILLTQLCFLGFQRDVFFAK